MNSMIDSYLLQKKQLEDLNEKTKRLSEENQALRLQIETFEKKRFHIKRKIKSTRFYKVYRKLKDRIPKKESNIHSPSRKLEFNYDYMLSSYEYRFLKYKKARNNGYKINIQRISTPYAQNLVSIVLPVYNGDDYVEASIKSVLSQTYKNFELIIVDDGSTDRTPEIVDSCAEKDHRIRVIHQENRKLPRTLSRGFREARGELFTWTSADNIMHPQFLEKFVGEMKKYNHTGMIYGNMRLIDENGSPKTDFDWYREDREHPDSVILPGSVLELNTFANNIVGAAFMYRAVVASVVEDYSQYKYGIEDYDYWMKINELFALRHTSFDDIEYSYRMHPKSLTSHDAELKITENRYRQMLLDEFRRDYLMKPVYWIIDTEDTQNRCYRELCDAILKNGHKILNRTKAGQQTENLYERMIYVAFNKDADSEIKGIPDTSYKVLISETSSKVKNDLFDLYICNSPVSENDFIRNFKGWFGIKKGEDIFAYIDSKAKNTFLYDLEGDEAAKEQYSVNMSVIISYGGNEIHLQRCMDSITYEDSYEIIVVAGCDNAQVIRDKFSNDIKIVSCMSDNDATRKNCAARIAAGKYLVFLQDDCICGKEYLENISSVFQIHPDIATILGRVDVELPDEYKGQEKLFGAYNKYFDDIYDYQGWNIPSAYSFAVRNSQFKAVGAFYHVAEEFGSAFCNMAIIGMCVALRNVGRYIYASINCYVTRIPEQVSAADLECWMMSEKLSQYNLEIMGILVYDMWPEELSVMVNRLKKTVSEKNNLMERISLKCYERLLEQVRHDFREKEKVDLIRDMYRQLP